MPEGFYIICECGYELYVREEDVGTEQTCISCSAVLDTHPSKVTSERASAQEDIVAPLEVSGIVEPKQEDDSKPTYSSPFEDADETDTPVPLNPRPVVAIEAEPEPEETPDYAASIFGDDSDNEAEDSSDINKPDPSLIRTYQDPEHKATYQDTAGEETCPQCGNLFRGDWDKQTLGDETICYICSNQATEGLPDRLKEDRTIAKNQTTHGPGWSGSLHADIPDGPIEEKFWLFNPESSEFRTMIYVLAFGLIGLTLIIVIFWDVSTPSPSSQSVGELESQSGSGGGGGEVVEPELPRWATNMYWAWQAFIIFTGQFLSIYLVLMFTDRLPHGKMIKDFAIVGFTMLLLTIMTVIYFASAATIGQTMMGPILMMMVNVVCLLPCIWIMIHILDFRIRDFFYLMFISGFVHSFLNLISMFFYAGLAKVAL